MPPVNALQFDFSDGEKFVTMEIEPGKDKKITVENIQSWNRVKIPFPGKSHVRLSCRVRSTPQTWHGHVLLLPAYEKVEKAVYILISCLINNLMQYKWAGKTNEQIQFSDFSKINDL